MRDRERVVAVKASTELRLQLKSFIEIFLAAKLYPDVVHSQLVEKLQNDEEVFTQGDVEIVVMDLILEVNDDLLLRFLQDSRFSLLRSYFEPLFERKEQVEAVLKNDSLR